MSAVAALMLLLLAGSADAAAPADAEVEAVARQLRCVVCQNLSIADSPSEMARQMRDVVRDRLARGATPEAVKAYFVERYGEWVLLSPPTRGFGLLAWALPLGGLGGGLLAAVVVLKRWSRRVGAGAATTDDEIDAADLEAARAAMNARSE